jgi:hypothetical protein
MKPHGAGVSTAVSEKDQGAGVLTPSNNDAQNGTEVPAPSEETSRMKNNTKGESLMQTILRYGWKTLPKPKRK